MNVTAENGPKETQARALFTREPIHGTKAQKVFLLAPTRSLFPYASIFSIYLPANCSVTTPLSSLRVCWTVCVTGGFAVLVRPCRTSFLYCGVRCI